MKEQWLSLSLEIDESTLAFPGDEGLKINKIKTWDKDNYILSQVSLTMHLGTHMDYKSHVLNEEDHVDFNQFIGKANVIFIQAKSGIIRTKDIELAYQYINQAEDMLIISTNHEHKINTQAYWAYPKFEPSILEFLKKHHIRLLAADLPSYEYVEGDMLQMHRDLLSNDIYLLENLVHLDRLSSHIELMVLPIPIKGLEAALVNVIAKNL